MDSLVRQKYVLVIMTDEGLVVLTISVFLVMFFISSWNSGNSQEGVVCVSIPDKKLLVWWNSLRTREKYCFIYVVRFCATGSLRPSVLWVSVFEGQHWKLHI